MDKNRVAGSIKEVKGAGEEAVGKAIGDAKLQSDGKTDKAVGKIQNAVGGLSDAVRDAAKKPYSPSLQTTLTCPQAEI